MSIEIIISDETKRFDSYQSVIRYTGSQLSKINAISDEYIDACINRELDFPTGLLLSNGQGVAMPHGNADYVNSNSISVLRLKTPVEFGLMEDKEQRVKCTMIFNLALTSGQQHIETLRKLMQVFQDKKLMNDFGTISINAIETQLFQRING